MKKTYVRAHYRVTRKKSGMGIFACIIMAYSLMNIMALIVNPPVGLLLLTIPVGVLVIRSILRRRKRHMIVKASDNRPALQSRYIPEDIKRFVMERDNYRCRSCGSNLYPEIDHIIPFSRGGSNHPDNLQVLCRGCNSQKRASV